MNNMTRITCFVAFLGCVSASAFGQEKLQDPGFEACTILNACQTWDFTAAAPWSLNNTTHNPGGPFQGTKYVSIQKGGAQGETWRGFQVLGNGSPASDTALTAGQELKLSGVYAGGAQSTGDLVTVKLLVQLRDTNENGTILAQSSTNLRVKSPPTDDSIGWTAFELYGAPTVTTAAVVFGFSDSTTGWSNATAVHVDNFSLTVAPACGSQHSITGINPASVDNDQNLAAATISGSGLAGLDGTWTVELQPTVTGQAAIPATNVQNVAAGSFQADFATSGATPGLYDVVVIQPGCNPRRLSEGFEITCPLGLTTVDTVGGDRGESGTVHTIEINGTNLTTAVVSSVELITTKNAGHPTRPGGSANPIVCANLTNTGTGIQADCDLTDVEGGRYRVVVNGNHPCGSTYFSVVGGFSEAFLVYMPFNGTLNPDNGDPFVAQNPSFELGYLFDASGDPLPPVCEDPVGGGENPKALHWDWKGFGGGGDPVTGSGTDANNGWDGANAMTRDKTLGFGTVDSCEGGVSGPGVRVIGVDGDHYADATFLDGDNGAYIIWQTVDVSPLLDGNDQLIDDLEVRANFWVHGGSQPTLINAFVDLIDGTETSAAAVWSSDPIAPPPNPHLFADDNYVATVPAGTTWLTLDPALLTVRCRLVGGAHMDANPFRIIRVDHVRSGPPINCNTPWADADGDGDVDQDDFAVIQLCLTGTGGGIPALPEYCACMDNVEDGDITQADVNNFEDCATGPTVQFVPEDHPLCTP